MGIEGKISVVGSGNHPSAPRVPWPEGTPSVNAPPKFAGEVAPAASPPAVGPRGLPASPPAQPAADSVEALRAAAASRAAERAARAEERRTAKAAQRAAIKEREADLAAREERLKAIEARLQSYRLAPHLALEDLRQYGVSFEQLAQAVADGRGPSLEQMAAVEAQAARQEVARLREDVERRERDARVASEREQVAARREAEHQVVEDWKANAAKVVEGAREKYPLVARTLDRGSLDAVFETADRIFTENRREPSFEEAIQATEERLQREWAEIAGAGGTPPPPPGRAAAPSPRESSGSPSADRRAWFLREVLDKKLRGLR